MKILLAPGQGSQTPGFLVPWIEAFPNVAEILKNFSEAADVDLIHMGTAADESTIKDTAVAQPLIVGASLAVARATGLAGRFDGFAGHSVGEFAAAALAGVLTDQEAMQLVGVRARAMAKAAAEVETGMLAVLGTDTELISGAISKSGLVIANYNGAGQFVAAGPITAIEYLVSNTPERVRAIPLKVAGAFHTEFMKPAVEALQAAAAKVEPKDPSGVFWSNRDGLQIESGTEILASLVSQVSNPVRWDLCMNTFTEAEVDLAVELPPAGALAGLLKRGAPSTNPLALKSPTDLENL